MSKISLPKPCAAYAGMEPYIFISYAHVDGNRVYPEIKALHDRGYRIWYDEGIDPSDEWLKEIAQAIESSAIYMVFITESAIQSYYVNKEVRYAINKHKRLLPVYLEEVSLPNDWELGMGDIQAILKWEVSEDQYLRKMAKALPEECLEKTEQAATRDVVLISPDEKLFTGQSNLAVNQAVPIDKDSNQKSSIPDGFIFIQGGTFWMGSPGSEADRGNNETQHQVRVGDFYLAQYPVTVAQFETFITESNYRIGSSFGRDWRCTPSGELQTDKQHPVIYVSWNDAMAYCQWLSQRHHQAFRLPTEVQWEYACRAGTITPFNTGANLTTDQANYNGNFPYQNFSKGRYIGKTTSVGSYPPNGWGLYDMHGNVLEWCLDWYGEKYYNECKRKGIVENPQCSKKGSFRVLRGGSWSFYAGRCRSSSRSSYPPRDRDSDIGFRLVFLP